MNAIDPDKKAAELAEEHALCFSIGTYFKTFSHVEMMVSVLTSLIMKVDTAVVQFLWRDVGLKMKTKGARRAARETFGEKDPRYAAMSSLLNKIEKCSDFRNDLAHGTFIGGHGGNTLGRTGQSYQRMLTEFDPINGNAILMETAKLQEIFSEFGKVIFDNFSRTSDTISAPSSRGNQ